MKLAIHPRFTATLKVKGGSSLAQPVMATPHSRNRVRQRISPVTAGKGAHGWKFVGRRISTWYSTDGIDDDCKELIDTLFRQHGFFSPN